jgi:hypothetical protein
VYGQGINGAEGAGGGGAGAQVELKITDLYGGLDYDIYTKLFL